MSDKHPWFHLVKTNLILLFNAGSLMGTTLVTSLLGFVYWWVAARVCTPNAVGLASALVSVMTLLGTISMLGLGTLLTGELPRQPGKEWNLIDLALLLVGGAGMLVGIIFALAAPFVSPAFRVLGTNILSPIFFACGVGLTALTMVLDQAYIGILRGDLQFWRNTLFAAVKLGALAGAVFLFASRTTGMLIYITWLAGNLVSLIILCFGRKRWRAREVPEKEEAVKRPAPVIKEDRVPCPDCYVLVPSQARFCPLCGYPLSPTIEIACVRPQLLFAYEAVGPLDQTQSRGNLQPAEKCCAECGQGLPARACFCSRCGYPLAPTTQVASIKLNHSDFQNVAEQAQVVPAQERKRGLLAHWKILRQLGGAALQHHMINLILLVPPLVLPLLVTVQLSAADNAWFYVSFMLANLVFSLTYALTTVLYAVGSAQPLSLARHMRLTLGLAVITSLGANVILQPGAALLLGIFGHVYAAQAAWCLRLLSLAVFPLIIISHYVALCRIQQRMIKMLLPVTLGALVELAGAALGAHLGGLAGVSLGWLAGLTLEALYMAPAVSQAAFPTYPSQAFWKRHST